MIEIFRIDCAYIPSAPVVEEYHRIGTHVSRQLGAGRPVAELGRKGTAEPDCIGAKFPFIPLLFSSRIIETCAREGLTGLISQEVKIDSRKCRNLKLAPGNRYFAVSPSGPAIKFAYRVYEYVKPRFEFRFQTDDPRDPRLIPTTLPYTQQTRTLPKLDTWDRADFIQINGKTPTYSSGAFYCSRVFVELAKKHGWSNLSFDPIDAIGFRGKDFREFSWPPELWYSQSHPQD